MVGGSIEGFVEVRTVMEAISQFLCVPTSGVGFFAITANVYDS